MIAFGPVPSRRLGRSLGVNNIPFKHCSYSCIYCQLGKTEKLTIERRKFYPVERIFDAVAERLSKVGGVDYITFVPDGEPTLDVELGVEVRMLKKLGKVAVITNSSLLSRKDVREDLMECDLVSVKVDAVETESWKRINRPHPSLNLGEILNGLCEFADEYEGKLITETMLIDGFSTLSDVRRISSFLHSLHPDECYIAIPVRPTAEGVRGVTASFLVEAKGIFEREGLDVKLLSEPEKGDFVVKSKDDILAIASVHPIREDILRKYANRLNINIDELEGLEVLEFEGVRYYRTSVR